MRVSTVALCTLALLVAEEWSATAIAPPTDSPSADPPAAPTPNVDVLLEESASLANPTPAEVSAPESSPSGNSLHKMAILAASDLPTSSASPPLVPTPPSNPSVDGNLEPRPVSLAQPTPPVAAVTPEVLPVPPAVDFPERSSTNSASADLADHSSLTRTQVFSPTAPTETTQPFSTQANLLAQDGRPITPTDPARLPSREEIEDLQERLRDVGVPPADFGDVYEGSPAITIAVPSGYGADGGTGFANFGFQTSVRDSDEADASMNVGIGLGDADEAVGVQVSYTLASFGANRDFGTGGFNAKIHRRLGNGLSVAVGWEGFLTVGDDPVDFEDSLYGAITYVAETSPDLDDPFSRIAMTAGVGSGRFRTVEAIEDEESGVGVFSSVAFRIARPVSAIVEWTGQDLALGLSVAPFRDFPLVITPALRDVAGTDGPARLVIGAGVSFRF